MITTILIIIALTLCAVAAFFIGYVAGLGKGFSNAVTMLERYRERNGGGINNSNNNINIKNKRQ